MSLKFFINLTFNYCKYVKRILKCFAIFENSAVYYLAGYFIKIVVGQLTQSQAIDRVESQTLPRVVVFEKRRDHGTRRIVSVPVPETSFFLHAADGRKGRDAKRDARAAFTSCA